MPNENRPPWYNALVGVMIASPDDLDPVLGIPEPKFPYSTICPVCAGQVFGEDPVELAVDLMAHVAWHLTKE